LATVHKYHGKLTIIERRWSVRRALYSGQCTERHSAAGFWSNWIDDYRLQTCALQSTLL